MTLPIAIAIGAVIGALTFIVLDKDREEIMTLSIVERLREPWKDQHRRWALERDAADVLAEMHGTLETVVYCARLAEQDASDRFKADFANIRIVASEALAKVEAIGRPPEQPPAKHALNSDDSAQEGGGQ